jgi:multiphosphoryl transfer protein
MLPMVTQVSELRLARQLLQEQAQRLGLSPVAQAGDHDRSAGGGA